MMADLPPHVRRRVQRRFDRLAARLLAEELDAQPARPMTGTDRDRLDDIPDQTALLNQRSRP